MSRITERIARILVNKCWPCFWGLVVCTLVLALFLGNISLDNSLSVWFLADDPALTRYEEFKDLYGNDEIIIALIQTDGEVFEKSFINRIFDVTKHLEANTNIKRVLSITGAPYVSSPGDSLVIEDMVPDKPGPEYSADTHRKRVFSNPLWKKLLLNPKETATVILIEPIAHDDMDANRPVILKFVTDSLQGFTYRLAGMGVLYEELNRISLRDSPLFTSLAYIILLFALLILFRRAGVLGAAAVTMVFSSLVFLGIMGLFHQSFNMISAILPSLVIILCLADLVHIFSHYEKATPGKNRTFRTLSYVITPCLFTSITTALGFSALASSPMQVLKGFGIFAAAGVLVAYAVSLIIGSVFLVSRERKEVSRSDTDSGNPTDSVDDFFDRLTGSIFSVVNRHYRFLVCGGLLLVVLGILGISRLTIDTYSMNFLLDKNQVKQDSFHIEADYGLYVPLEIRLKPAQGSVKSPGFLDSLSQLQENLENQPVFDKSSALSDVVKHLNRVLNENSPEAYRIPRTREEVGQELLLYEMDSDNDLEYFVPLDYSEVRLTVRIPMVSSATMKSYISLVKNEISRTFDSQVTVTFGGYIPLYVKMMEYILQSQITSFLIAFCIIFLIMALLFRSPDVLVLGIVPNVLPVFLTLGIMGWLGINLDIATVTIAAIAIGISVDDTIHFIFMFKKKRNQGLSTRDAIEHTLKTSGRAIIITSVLLIMGYLVLVFASVKSVIYFGLLIAIAMGAAVLSDLLLLPALLLLFSKKETVSP